MGISLTLQAISQQLAAMPCGAYEVRLIHGVSRSPLPGRREWSAATLLQLGTVKFLRFQNRRGYDVYLRPGAGRSNAGYVLVDADEGGQDLLAALRHDGYDPCVLVETSPGRRQAWVRLSETPVVPALATAAAKYFAHAYHADFASADWRHLGRLAGCTNQKPARRQPGGLAPWVRLLYARAVTAPAGPKLLQQLRSQAAPAPRGRARNAAPSALSAAPAAATYRACLERLGILPRFPYPDWSTVDLWIARDLLRAGMSAADLARILRYGSPGFPRRHADPDDYLRRTLARAVSEL